MGRIFDDWKKALDNFKKSVDKELKEIRECKAEVQRLRTQLSDEFMAGKFIRDDNRIILSAPEIIIGNVDVSGELMNSGGSVVVVRGGDVSLQGCGEGGKVEVRAPRIQQLAVDPGNDGTEDVVGNVSEIISQAKSISIQSNNDENVFSSPTVLPGPGGLLLHADKSLTIEATIKADSKKKEIDDLISRLEDYKKTISDEVNSSKTRFEELVKKLTDILDKNDKLKESELGIRSDISDILELNDEFDNTVPSLQDIFASYSKNISILAEINRKINKLKEAKNKIKTGDDFIKQTTGATLRINGENISLANIDGEGNVRENPGTGVNIISKNIALVANKNNGALIENGNINISAQNLNLQTFDRKNEKIDNKGKKTSGEYPAKGNINLMSKTVNIESYDYEIKDNKFEKKNLAKDGKLSLKCENIDLATIETDGKATGDISMNSKSIAVKSMDLDKEKGTDQALSTGSSMLLISEKMFIGGKDKDTESKLVQTSSESIGTFAKNTFEVQQGEKKSILQMDGGKMSVSGDSTGIYGKTTINEATEIKGELKVPKATIDNVEAKSSFKSPNISDGIAVGAGGGGGSLSAKLQQEELKNSK